MEAERNEPGAGGPAPAVGAVLRNIGSVFIGPAEIGRLVLTCLLARGHLLIEDVPGIGKTLLGIALARSIASSFRRIQFTNDLLPSDIVGASIYSLKDSTWAFKTGPLFANVVLADEINRATPKTQSALLEAMNDRQVSVDGTTYPLPEPFMIIATQNPVEYHGTFPLPEAQLDRFLMRLRIGYPGFDAEKEIIRGRDLYEQAGRLSPVLAVEDVRDLQRAAEDVRIEESLLGYIVGLAERSRRTGGIKLGVSPRGALLLRRAAQAFALTEGRTYVVPDDIKAVALPVLGHRIVIDSSSYGLTRIQESDAAVLDVLRNVPVPV